MNKIFLTLSLAALAAAAHAQSETLALGARAFEMQAEAAILPISPSTRSPASWSAPSWTSRISAP